MAPTSEAALIKLQMGSATAFPSATPNLPPSGLLFEAGMKSHCMSMTIKASFLLMGGVASVMSLMELAPASESHSVKSSLYAGFVAASPEFCRKPCHSSSRPFCQSHRAPAFAQGGILWTNSDGLVTWLQLTSPAPLPLRCEKTEGGHWLGGRTPAGE